MKYNLVMYNPEGNDIYQAVNNLFRQNLTINCEENDLRDAYRLKSGGKPNKHHIFFIECSTSKFKVYCQTTSTNGETVDGKTDTVQEIHLTENFPDQTDLHRSNSTSSISSKSQQETTLQII
ncbi:hypothetical protein JTB14_000716 [Gonioctena quinquepunctata]|nr:hypothetical protein JTB14_000716 [Gonioctena quinquepunctata]